MNLEGVQSRWVVDRVLNEWRKVGVEIGRFCLLFITSLDLRIDGVLGVVGLCVSYKAV